jgi:hypothetical protein
MDENADKRQLLFDDLAQLAMNLRDEGRREDADLVSRASIHMAWLADAPGRFAQQLRRAASEIEAGSRGSYSNPGVAAAALRLEADRLEREGDVIS